MVASYIVSALTWLLDMLGGRVFTLVSAGAFVTFGLFFTAMFGLWLSVMVDLDLTNATFEYIPKPSLVSRGLYFAAGSLLIYPCKVVMSIITLFGRRRLNANDVSWWEEKFITRKHQLRNLFIPNNRPIRVFPCHSGHSHPQSASNRSAANEYMAELAEISGYVPYVVSRSNRDRGDGARLFYHEKDYHVPYQNDPVKPHHALIFTDVDYYADMNEWMKSFLPIVMYTLVPKQLTYRGGEFSYYVNGDGTLSYHVKGGASYQHPLWHYKGDTVTVLDWYMGLCIYDIEQRDIAGDEHHRFIWLTPKARIGMLGWIFNPLWYGKAFGLERLSVRSGTVDYLWDAVTDFLSVRATGTKYSVELDGEIFHAISERLLNKKDPPVTSDIERMLTTAKYDQHKAVRMAPLLLKCWDFDEFKPNIISTGKFQTNFQALPRTGALGTEDGREVGRHVTTPITARPALFAAKGYNADKECIAGRVDKPRNIVDPPKEYYTYAREFVNLIIPEHVMGTGTPMSCSEVNEAQSKPSQRARWEQVAHTMSSLCQNKLKSFIKTEAYAAPNSPRNITTCSPELTINFSRYSLPLSSYLKKFKWYGIGMSPKQAIRRMRDLAAKEAAIRGLVPSDFSRFDGSVSKFLQECITLAMGLRYYGEAHRASYKQYHDGVFKKSAITADNVRYDPGFGTRSGSPQTSWNTLMAAFSSFASLRKMGYPAETAFLMLGVHTGDDGVTPNYAPAYGEDDYATKLPQVTAELGQKLESTVIHMNNPVPYCGRYFANPWLSNETFQDPMRTLTKIHLSGSKGLSQEQAAANRAHGYLSTDRLTPVIGTYARKCLELAGGLKFKGGTNEEQYKCSNSWPQRDREQILVAMAQVLDCTTDEIEMKEALLHNVSGLDQFPVLFDNPNSTAKCLAVVDGEVIGMDPHTETNRFLSKDERKPKTSSGIVEPGSDQSGERFENLLGKHNGGAGTQKRQPTECGHSRSGGASEAERAGGADRRRTTRPADQPNLPARSHRTNTARKGGGPSQRGFLERVGNARQTQRPRPPPARR